MKSVTENIRVLIERLL